jgi:hypothetical protein
MREIGRENLLEVVMVSGLDAGNSVPCSPSRKTVQQKLAPFIEVKHDNLESIISETAGFPQIPSSAFYLHLRIAWLYQPLCRISMSASKCAPIENAPSARTHVIIVGRER